MIRKIFGWILIALGLFCVLGAIASMSMNSNGLSMLPYMIIWVYIFAFSGYRLIAMPKEEDVIAIWKKILIYFTVAIICLIIGVIIGTICNNNATLMAWIFVISFIITIESDIIKNWMLKAYYRKHPERSPLDNIESEDIIEINEDKVLNTTVIEKPISYSAVETVSEQEIKKPLNVQNNNNMKTELTFQQKVNMTLFILTGLFLVLSIIFFFCLVIEDDEFVWPWLIFSLIATFPRILWWYFNHKQINLEDAKKYGLAFLISGFVLLISPFYAIVSLFFGGKFTKQVFDNAHKMEQ